MVRGVVCPEAGREVARLVEACDVCRVGHLDDRVRAGQALQPLWGRKEPEAGYLRDTLLREPGSGEERRSTGGEPRV